MFLFLILACNPDTTTAAPALCGDIEPVESAAPESEPLESEPVSCELFTWYEDCDGDGFGYFFEGDYPPITCDGEQPAVSDPSRCLWRTVAGDCDDTDPAMHPINGELCDGRDNDCDSYADEGC